MPLLAADELFQTLFTTALPAFGIGSDLDTDSFDEVPFLTHQSVIAQLPNGTGGWQVTLTVNLFLEPGNAFEHCTAVYDVVQDWGELPRNGLVEAVGVVVTVEDLNAFSAMSGEVEMLNKVIRHYQAQFAILARILPA